jgi:subtilase family serine protease
MLDVEWAYAMAPGAKIVVVVAKDATLGNLLGAVNYAYTTVHATVVSMSWGATEFSTEKNYDSYFNHPGTSYVAASGDAGSIVDWPAVSSYVLGVGGTSLVYDSLSATVTSETGWSGSGGGISKYVQIPSYQVGFNNNAGRGVPDVSYDADPYTGFNVYLTDPGTNLGGWYVYGGTSAGAPQWAALLARRASLGNGGSTLINTVLYSASKTNYPGLFRDITSGSSGLPAVTGYDLVTGLGSPLADKIAALAYPTASASPSPSASARPSASPSPTPTPTRGKR